jgi:hypothetical protein
MVGNAKQMISGADFGSPGSDPRPVITADYSVLRCSPAFVILALVIACANNMADPDLWIHLMAGKQIISAGHIPLRDLYSYSAAGLPWRDHEWLAQVVLALSYGALGVFGLKLVKLLCITIVMSALAVGMSKTAALPRVQRLTLLAAAVGMVGQIQFRPQLFTYAMLAILMAALAAEVYRGPVRLWPLIPMFALWANLHGGYLTGLAALSIFSALLAVHEMREKRENARAWRVLGVTAGCVLATLLNPVGTGVWAGVIHTVSDPVIKSNVQEWNTLPAAIVSQWNLSLFDKLKWVMPLGLFAAFGASLVAAPVLDDAELASIAVVFIGAALYTYRNIALAIIALSIPFARHVGLALHRRAAPHPQMSNAEPGAVFVALAALVLALKMGEFSNRLKLWAEVPASAVAFMNAHGLHGNILNNYDWGSYLIWHSAGHSKVFVDGRCELVYPDSLLREYFVFLNGLPGGKALLDRYPHDFVLLSPGNNAYRTVANDQRWKLIYRDPVAALFARRSSVAAGDISEETPGVAEQSSFP